MIARNKSLGRSLNGIGVSRETETRLQVFYALFLDWSKTINLVAPSTLDLFWDRHIADSAQLFQMDPSPAKWIDLGSGGGFPGIITAIFLAELEEGWVHLVESNNKKAAFLRMALLKTGARGSVHAIRIEDAPASLGMCDRISARALADLAKLLGYISPWAEMNPAMRAFLHKGRDYQAEIAISRRRWEFDLVKHISTVEQDSVILEISRLMRKAGSPG